MSEHQNEPEVRFLTISEAAQRLKVGKRYVEYLIHTGDLKVHRFGRSVRIKCSVLDELAEGAAEKPLPSMAIGKRARP